TRFPLVPSRCRTGLFPERELSRPPWRQPPSRLARSRLGYVVGDDDRDFSLISEIGATAVRLAHYQHNQHVYDLTDRLGFVVWAEIPNIDSVNLDGYLDTTQNQLRELIRQNYNHPSIVFWSVGNELGAGGGPDPTPTVQALNTLAKAEDPSRLTTLATV